LTSLAPVRSGTSKIGVVPAGEGVLAVSVWAPRAASVSVEIGGHRHPLAAGQAGYHAGEVPGGAGDDYRFVLGGTADDAEQVLPDPASRWQPEGIFGPSRVVDLGAHHWSDGSWRPPELGDYVFYELHVGTFRPEGTLDAAAGALGHLCDLGATAVELMPVAQFPGRRNWGYDGVFPFAVQDSYGGPAALQRFVDAAHGLGLAVVLDVVYNHLGPEGNVLPAYGPYLTDRYRTPWGKAVNFDGPGSDEVRRFFATNALEWFEAFHADALRLDAVHGIVDRTARPFLVELADDRAELAERLGRPLVLIAESSDNDPRVVTPTAAGGLGMDAQWDDDFHHALHVALTGERFGYYEDFSGPAEVARAMDGAFVLTGQHSRHRGRRHGAPATGVEPERFVVFAQNHDHVGNRPAGDRLGAGLSLDARRLAAAAVVLSPYLPLLFMGEEYGETAPFPYFVDHQDPATRRDVVEGRSTEMAGLGAPGEVADPTDPATFAAAVPDLGLRGVGDHARLWDAYRGLLAVRRAEPALRRGGSDGLAAASSDRGVVAVVRASEAATALVVLNFSPEPGHGGVPGDPPGPWRTVADSADPRLGGSGPLLAPSLRAGAEVPLAPFGFCALTCAREPS
jgi:maltooligosyltrehalose trehalohydrolase